jgi:hypothetical protein
MSVKDYLKLSEFAKTFNYGLILDELTQYFNYLHDKEDMDNIGLKLQISIKKSKPMYLHGYVISSTLHKYLTDNNYDNINILETGTARGFSSVAMAKILDKFNNKGKIYTIDHYNGPWNNCIKSAELGRKITMEESIEEWSKLVNKYITFLKGNSQKKLGELNSKLERIHFAFLDGAHFYKDVKMELEYTEKKQLSGDVIVCDDYTKTQFPEICKAIDEFLSNKKYEYKIFYGNDGTKKRGYVYMKKI